MRPSALTLAPGATVEEIRAALSYADESIEYAWRAFHLWNGKRLWLALSPRSKYHFWLRMTVRHP